MSYQKTQIECDHCGCEEFIAYTIDDGPLITLECDACGTIVLKAKIKP
jgi:uncharacterized Zn finger protein